MKGQPNHRQYIAVLRGMGAERRLAKAFELSEFSRALLWQGLKDRHPELEERALRQLYVNRLSKTHSRAD